MPLTWREVSAPDFTPALRAQAHAAALIQGALGTAGTGLNAFDAAETDRVNQVAQANLLKYQDPAQLQAALQSGALFAGLDPARIRPETMTTANSRVGDLLSSAVSSENLAQDTYNNQFLNGERLREMDARVPYAASIAGSGGNPALAQLSIEAQERARSDNLSSTGTVNTLNEAERTRQIRDFSVAVTPQLQRMTPNEARAFHDAQKTPEEKAVVRELSAKIHGGELFGKDSVVDQYDSYRPGSPGGAPVPIVPGGVRPATGAAWAAAVGLTANESGGKTNASNDAVGSGGKVGHFGLLQFGQDRLADAKAAGVIPKDMTPEQYRDSGAEVQNRVADWHFADIDRQAAAAGLDKYYGKTVKGVVIDRDAIRGMAHLGGMTGVKNFLASNGEKDPADQNNTKLSDYGKRFGGTPTPVGVDPRPPAADPPPPPAAAAAPVVAAPVPVPAKPLTQAESDRAAMGSVMDKAGRAIADVVSLPVRGVLGAYDSTMVRGMRATGIPAAYLSPSLVPNGVDPASMTPYMDARRLREPAAAPVTPPQATTPAPADQAGALISNAAVAEVPPLTSAVGAKMLLESVNKETNFNASLLPIANDAAAFTPDAQGVPELTQELLSLPMFKGGDRGQITNQMNSLVQKGVAPRVAAAILKNSVTQDTLITGLNGIFGSAADNISGAFGSVVIDEKVRDNLADLAKGNKEISKVQQNNEVQKEFTTAQTAKLAEIQKMEAALLTQKIRAEQGLGDAPQRYALMQQEYQRKLQEFQNTIMSFQAAKRK